MGTIEVPTTKVKLLKYGKSVITLSLLHPIQDIPVQTWSFERESTIKVGRSTDNDVILYSAVVSRHHVELRYSGSGWEAVNVGTNGTYIEGKKVEKIDVVDGTVLRLAYSGPKIQIRINADVEDKATEIEKVLDRQKVLNSQELSQRTVTN
ncbi:MAG: FHA domain-containing protein [Prochloraceae cyanobacterium]|nr:FHA domain-containing protein [Prochloraceae cyanobacterium]